MDFQLDDAYCLRYIKSLRDIEAKDAKHDRMETNRENFEQYQLRHDFSHKHAGQSKEVLSKTRNAVESSKAFFQQALADLDDWFRVVASDGTNGDGMLVRPDEAQRLLSYMLKKADYFSHVGAQCQLGLLGALAISTVGGEMVPKPKFKTKKEGRGTRYKKHVVVVDDKTWELRFMDVRQEDYYPDPTGRDLYRIVDSIVDLHEVRALAEGEEAIYDKAAVDLLKGGMIPDDQAEKRARETGQNVTNKRLRPQVKLTDFWGTIVDENTGEVMAENVVVTVANDDTVIRKATPNPKWHQRKPVVAAALIEFATSVWGIALMDAGTKHNRVLSEIFNLMIDSGMKAVWGITQIRTDVLTDSKQITDGIKWGTALKVNSSLPPGAKVMEEVITGSVQNDVIEMFNLLNQETLTSMKTNDLRMGAQSQRAVKATEVVAAENSITSEFQGIAKNFEEKKIQPELELAMYEICQNWDRIDKEIFVSLFGRDRGEALAALEPQEVFVQVINGMKFEVYGISLTLRRQADFRKWTTVLQVVSQSPVLTEAFLKDYSFEKLLGEVLTAIDINKSKIKADAAKDVPGQGGPQQTMQQPGGAPGAQPNQLSQMPSPANVPQGGLAAAFSGQGNAMQMPSAQAMR